MAKGAKKRKQGKSHSRRAHPMPSLRHLVPSRMQAFSAQQPVSYLEDAPLTPQQSAELTNLGAKCYSPIGQTRLFWSHLPPWASVNLWFRFHFFQAAILSWIFLSIDCALLAYILLSVLLGVPPESLRLIGALLGLFIALHIVLFTYLAQSAGEGKALRMPLAGFRAACLAVSPKRLEECKLF